MKDIRYFLNISRSNRTQNINWFPKYWFIYEKIKKKKKRNQDGDEASSDIKDGSNSKFRKLLSISHVLKARFRSVALFFFHLGIEQRVGSLRAASVRR